MTMTDDRELTNARRRETSRHYCGAPARVRYQLIGSRVQTKAPGVPGLTLRPSDTHRFDRAPVPRAEFSLENEVFRI